MGSGDNGRPQGADYQKKLVWRTTEGFNVRPYYRAEDLEGIKYLGKKSGEFPYVRGNRCNNRWRIHETIAVKDVAEANRLALHAVEAGADSIGFDLSEKLSAQQVADLMAGIDLNATELAFSGKPDAELPDKVLSVAEAKKADPEKFRVFFGFDPLIRQLCTGAFCDGDDGQQCYKTIAGFVRGAKAWPKAKFVTVSGETFQNSGSTITQELAFTLAAGHEYLVKLTEAGLSAEEAARTIRFSMAVSSNYFMEMAKFRAGRMLWANIVNAVHGRLRPQNVHPRRDIGLEHHRLRPLREHAARYDRGDECIPRRRAFAGSAPVRYSLREPHGVLLAHRPQRATAAARTSPISTTWYDPAGGSYYIENLTAEHRRTGMEALQGSGGHGAVISAAFRRRISFPDADRRLRPRRRTTPWPRAGIVLLGTNQYPEFQSRWPSKRPLPKRASSAACCYSGKPAEGTCARCVHPRRHGLRTAPPEAWTAAEKQPEAFMLTCGSLAFARARAQFSCNFFACAGIRVQDNTYFKSLEEGVKAALDAKADIVVICAADDDYATLAPEAAKMIGDKAIFVVAGAPACMADLEAQGIKNFIHVKSNVLETLKYYLKELGI